MFALLPSRARFSIVTFLMNSPLRMGKSVAAVGLPILHRFSRRPLVELEAVAAAGDERALDDVLPPLSGFLARRQTPSPTLKPLALASVIS